MVLPPFLFTDSACIYFFQVICICAPPARLGLVVKNPPANAEDVRDTRSIPGSGRSPGRGNGKPLLYSCLGNPKDRRAWQATVRGITKSWTRLSNWTQSAARLLTNLAEFRQFINYFMLDFIVFHLWWDYNSYRSLLCTLSAVLNTHTHTHTHTHIFSIASGKWAAFTL